jgi:hypothetical protein
VGRAAGAAAATARGGSALRPSLDAPPGAQHRGGRPRDPATH